MNDESYFFKASVHQYFLLSEEENRDEWGNVKTGRYFAARIKLEPGFPVALHQIIQHLSSIPRFE